MYAMFVPTRTNMISPIIEDETNTRSLNSFFFDGFDMSTHNFVSLSDSARFRIQGVSGVSGSGFVWGALSMLLFSV